MDARQRESLDNHITGHYGEDQFGGSEGVYIRDASLTAEPSVAPWHLAAADDDPGEEPTRCSTALGVYVEVKDELAITDPVCDTCNALQGAVVVTA